MGPYTSPRFTSVSGGTSAAVLICAPPWPGDNVECDAGDDVADARGRLGRKGTGREEDAFLALAGFVFVLVDDVRHHRAERHVGLHRAGALDDLDRDQERDQQRIAVLGEPVHEARHNG